MYTRADMARAWDEGLRYGLQPHKNANPFAHEASNPYLVEPTEKPAAGKHRQEKVYRRLLKGIYR